jgi:hypothetical protein
MVMLQSIVKGGVDVASCAPPTLPVVGPDLDASFEQFDSGQIARMAVDDPARTGIDYKLIVVPPQKDVEFMPNGVLQVVHLAP